MVPVLTIEDLPPPPVGRQGWPWTEVPPPLPDAMPNGTMWPRMSIVTPSYNQGQYIEETLRSVILQGYPNLKYIVIDGGSTDDSVDIIRRYEPWLTYWVSEKDRGQSHAINKGLAHCTGQIFNWLNSDDVWCPRTARAVAEAWTAEPPTIVAGTVVNFSSEGEEISVVQDSITLESFVKWADSRTRRPVWHQPGVFMPLPEVRRCGGVREDLHLAMDFFLMIELLKTCQVRYVDEILARFRLHEDSKTCARFKEYLGQEIIETLRRMPSLPVHISGRELRKQHASVLAGCASTAVRDRRLARSSYYLWRAASLSPLSTALRCLGWLKRPGYPRKGPNDAKSWRSDPSARISRNMGMVHTSISVLITTYRRPQYLVRCLICLRAQRRPPDEVVIVRRKEDDEVRELLERYAVENPSPAIRVATTSRAGVISANNAGLPLVSGDIVVFLDDDSTAPPEWIERLVRHYDDPRVGAVGGRVENYQGGQRVYVERDLSKWSMRIDRFGRIHPGQMYAYSGMREVDHLRGCNMSFRRSLLVESDANLRGDGFRYETDLCLTAKAAGFRILLDGDAWNSHWCAPRQGVPERTDPTAGIYDRYFNEAYVLAKHERATIGYLARILTVEFPLAVARSMCRRNISARCVLAGAVAGLARGLSVGRALHRQQLRRITGVNAIT